MLGFPPLHYKILPPNSPEYHLREENHSEARSVATPLLEHPKGDKFQAFFVLSSNPPLNEWRGDQHAKKSQSSK